MQFMLPATVASRDASYPDEDYADWAWCASIVPLMRMEVLVECEEDCLD